MSESKGSLVIPKQPRPGELRCACACASLPPSRLIRSTSLSSTCRHCLHSYSSSLLGRTARERLKEIERGSGGRRSPHNSTYLEFRHSGHQLLAEAGEPAGGEEGGGKECCWCCNLADLLRCTVFSWNLDLQGVGTESYGWGWGGGGGEAS